MLREAGEDIEDYADMTYVSYRCRLTLRTPQEKFLGKLVKEKYHTDFCKCVREKILILSRCPR
jgi:hypothetical protein